MAMRRPRHPGVRDPEEEVEDVAEVDEARQAEAADEARRRLEAGGVIPELARRIVAAGLQSFFVTEEVVRKAVGDTLPQDWIDFATDQSTRTQAEFMDRLSREMGRVLERTDLAELLAGMLEGRAVEVNATFRLVPGEDGPSVRAEVRPPKGDASRDDGPTSADD